MYVVFLVDDCVGTSLIHIYMYICTFNYLFVKGNDDKIEQSSIFYEYVY